MGGRRHSQNTLNAFNALTTLTRVAPEAARPAPLGSDQNEHPARRGSRLEGRRLP